MLKWKHGIVPLLGNWTTLTFIDETGLSINLIQRRRIEKNLETYQPRHRQHHTYQVWYCSGKGMRRISHGQTPGWLFCVDMIVFVTYQSMTTHNQLQGRESNLSVYLFPMQYIGGSFWNTISTALTIIFHLDAPLVLCIFSNIISYSSKDSY